MRRQIFEMLASRGISLNRGADLQRLGKFIERMHPVATGKDLIRLGAEGDGGYLAPDDLDGLVGCFSPGVDVKASFELALASRGIPCYLADASVEKAPVTHPLIHFDKKFVGVVNDETTITMDRWISSCAAPDGDLILQMDIEGAEWPVLLNISDQALERFRIIVLELHSLERLVDEMGFGLMTTALDRLLRRFHVAHLHPNNVIEPVQVGGITIPRLLEVTLLRRDRAEPTGFMTRFPHLLDSKNVPRRPDVALPPMWYGRGN